MVAAELALFVFALALLAWRSWTGDETTIYDQEED